MHCFFACGYLTSDLRKGSVWVLRACLPPDIAEHTVKLLTAEDTPLRIPSPATLSRLRGRMDVAWMLVWRQELAQMLADSGLVMYPMVDSSPQAGRDYEMLVLSILRAAGLPRVHADIVALEQRCLAASGTS